MPPRAGICGALDDEVAAARRQHARACPAPNGRSGSAPQTPVASSTAAARTSNEAPESRSVTVAPATRPPSWSGPVARTRVTATAAPRALAMRRAHDRQRVARVVLHRVVVEQRAPEARPDEVRRILQRLRPDSGRWRPPDGAEPRTSYIVMPDPVEGAGRRPAARRAGTGTTRGGPGAARARRSRARSWSASRTSRTSSCWR